MRLQPSRINNVNVPSYAIFRSHLEGTRRKGRNVTLELSKTTYRLVQFLASDPQVMGPLGGLHSGYLSGRQLGVWHMLRSGHSQSEIARRLCISRQAVNQLARTIPEKITAALCDAARLNGVEPRHIDSSKGILFGWSRDFQTKAVITLNSEAGLRVWYQHNLGQCKICPDKRQCKSTLLKSAKDLDIPLTRQERDLDPSKLSSLVFSRVPGRDDEKKTRG